MAQPQEPQGLSDAQVASLIAAVLAGTVAIGAGTSLATAIASILGELVAAPGPPGLDLRQAVGGLVAELVELGGGAKQSSQGNDRVLELLTNNSGYSALYAVNAARRIQDALKRGEQLSSALSRESGNAQLHRQAVQQRDAGATLNLSAARAFGSTTLSWHHPGRTLTHRHSHVLADGKNYEVLSPPRSTDGMLPAMAPDCECEPAAPVPGGVMLA